MQSKRSRFEAKSKTFSDRNDQNPFEFHRNKVKHNIIGRKLAKNELGNKALSRNRAFNKRKNTILHEYKRKHKSGKGVQEVTDKEEVLDPNKNRNLSSVEFSGESTELTHKGKHLNDFIDDHIGSDDDDIDVFNRPEFVESAHFGGGTDGRPKSANELLSQIMDEKREKQLERAANVELTHKLDSEWSAIKNILKHKGGKHEESHPKEDFDILVKQLMFDNKSKPIVFGPSVSQTVQSTRSENASQPSTEAQPKSAKTEFKEAIEAIERETNWEEITSSLRRVSDILPRISEESLNILIEKYQTIINSKNLTANSFTLVLVGTHFKQTQPLAQIILAHFLSKLRYNSFQDIATALVIIKTLLLSCKNKFIPEMFASIARILSLAHNRNHSTRANQIGTKQCLFIENNPNISNEITFSPKFAFDCSLNTNSVLTETSIKLMLITESLHVLDQMLDSCSSHSSIVKTTMESDLSEMSRISVTMVSDLADALLSKVNAKNCKIGVPESRPKPFILPMFEPKFDLTANNSSKKNPKKKLIKKFKRELKGAQRELKKDSVFMRNTWIDEIKKKDQKRKDKVKEIMGGLAQQQGLYKKKKKRR